MADAATQSGSLFDTFSRAPLRFERGEGVWLVTESGERYLDFGAGVAVTSVGHSHPHMVDALKSQAEKVWHLSNLYEVPGQETLAKRLRAEGLLLGGESRGGRNYSGGRRTTPDGKREALWQFHRSAFGIVPESPAVEAGDDAF